MATTEEKAKAAADKAAAAVMREEERKAKAKANELARKAKAKAKAKAATLAKAKGAEVAAIKKLTPVAKEINHRLSKADKMEDDATDHRLAAALQLAVAKVTCKTAKIKFEDWCEQNVIVQSYNTVRRLATIGEAGKQGGLKLLNDMRGKNAEANKKARAKAKAAKVAGTGGDHSDPKPKADTPFTMVQKGLRAMRDDEAAKTVTSAASNLGLAVVSAGEAKAARKAGEVLQYGPVDQIKVLFDAASNADKMVVVNYVVEAVGASLATGFEAPAETPAGDDDLLDIPDSLKRKPAKRGGRRKKAA